MQSFNLCDISYGRALLVRIFIIFFCKNQQKMYIQYYVDNSAFRVYNKTIENVKMRRSNVMSWFVFALLSAVFAAATSILAKVGIDGVNSNLATAIRTVVVVVLSWGIVFITNAQTGLTSISKKSWIFLILSGIATGLSWICYYRALQIGDASKVVPIDKLSIIFTLIFAVIFLHEEFTVKTLIATLLIGAGALVLVL